MIQIDADDLLDELYEKSIVIREARQHESEVRVIDWYEVVGAIASRVLDDYDNNRQEQEVMSTLEGLINFIMTGVEQGRYNMSDPIPEEIRRYITGEQLPRMTAEEYAEQIDRRGG